MIQHLLFDNDGTLVDSEIIAVRTMLKCLAEHGLVLDEKTYSARYPGLRERDILAALQAEHGMYLPSSIIDDIKQEHAAAFQTTLRSIKGMPGIFRETKVPRSVVSNGSVRHVERSLKKVRLRSALNGQIFSAEHVQSPKPFPDVYLYALEQLQLRPNEVLVIEDSPTGVQAAKEAGLAVVGFLGAAHIHDGHAEKLQDLGADYIAADAPALRLILAAKLLI